MSKSLDVCGNQAVVNIGLSKFFQISNNCLSYELKKNNIFPSAT